MAGNMKRNDVDDGDAENEDEMDKSGTKYTRDKEQRTKLSEMICIGAASDTGNDVARGEVKIK